MIPRQLHFSEYEYYSVLHDAEVCRISVPDENGREFFAVVPLDGKDYKGRRDKAMDAIVEAMRLGLRPGEVRAR